jgi:ferredoxin, 2Fe-2S
MPRVTYLSHDGNSTTLEVPLGTSVMQAALLEGLDGIVAECGGSCMCATCHVFVQEDKLKLLPEMELGEDAMLDGTAIPRQPNSRLSCQLVMTPEMDGLVVTMPETQT